MNEITLTRLKLVAVFLLSNLLLFYKQALFLNLYAYFFIVIYIMFKKQFILYLSWLKPLLLATIVVFLIQTLTFNGWGITQEGLILGLVSSLRILSLSTLIFFCFFPLRLILLLKH